MLDAVVAGATVDLPEALVGARAQEIWETTLRTLDFEGVSKDVYLQIAGTTEDEALTELRPQAATELRREAVVAAIAAAEGITVSDDDLRAHDARVQAEAEASGEEVAPAAAEPGHALRSGAARARAGAAGARGHRDLDRGRQGDRQAVATGARARTAGAARAGRAAAERHGIRLTHAPRPAAPRDPNH